jgi:hypothetical protein
MGISIPSVMMDQEMSAALYPAAVTGCQGYCSDLTMRKIAILCALDNVAVTGKCGTDTFPEYSNAGIRVNSTLKRGRGVTISEGIRRPIATLHIVSCCCVRFALYVMN